MCNAVLQSHHVVFVLISSSYLIRVVVSGLSSDKPIVYHFSFCAVITRHKHTCKHVHVYVFVGVCVSALVYTSKYPVFKNEEVLFFTKALVSFFF